MSNWKAQAHQRNGKGLVIFIKNILSKWPYANKFRLYFDFVMFWQNIEVYIVIRNTLGRPYKTISREQNRPFQERLNQNDLICYTHCNSCR